MSPIVVRILQTAAAVIGAKLIEALIAELESMCEEMKKKQSQKSKRVITEVVRLVSGNKN